MDATARQREARARLDREVHVYTARPAASDEDADGRALLDEGERARLARLRRAADRALYLCAHVLVRSVLSRYADVAPADWRFAAGARGRPEIAAPRGSALRFNLSHTDGLAACVVTRAWDCGVDVESRERRRDPLAVVGRVTTPAERAALAALPERERRARFLELWTLKEAYVKARGAGLALPLRHYGFAETPDGIALVITAPDDADDPGTWQFALHAHDARHTLAVAVRRGDAPARPVVVDPRT